MALIECSECGREVSDSAAACPGCGAPVASHSAEIAQRSTASAVRPAAATPVLGVVGIVLGIAAVVMPYFAAVFLVPAAFICGLIVFRRGRKGLGAAAMVMAVIGLIGVLYVSQQITNIVKDPFAPNPLVGSGAAPVVTLGEYEQIREGMTYQEVSGVIGAAGQELSRSDVAGYATVMYSWSNENGSNMNAMFQNGKLVNKAQYGLR